MNLTAKHLLDLVRALRFTPAALSLPVPAHRVRSCSIRSPLVVPCYVSRTIERAALGTETGSPVHS
jgi:hypothetical protein